MTAFEDLSLLRAYLCIVECRSISAAARRMRVSQPTLSRQLRALEEACGIALLRRDTHQMSLTEAGQRMLVDAKTIIGHAEEADRRLREDHTTITGHLRLFATVDVGQFMVSRMVAAFLQQNPKVTASLSMSNRPLHMIQEGCDVGVLPGRITDESVIARPAGSISLGLAASPDFVRNRPVAKTIADIKSWPWISLAGSQFWGPRELTLHGPGGATRVLALNPLLEAEGVTAIREAACAGLGLTLLPDWLMDDALRGGSLVRVLPRWRAKPLPVHVVYAGQRLLPARVSAFIDFAVKYMTAELKRWS